LRFTRYRLRVIHQFMLKTLPPATQPAPRFLQLATRLTPYALIFIAFLVRLNSLDFQSLWRDEVDAICFAQAPLLKSLPQTALSFTPTCPPNIPDLVSSFTQSGFNGPLYFLLLRGWISLTGTSELALRFFSLLCGVISVALIITLGTRLFNRAIGLIAGALLALSAYQVWYSQEAKMYTLITLLALAAIYFLRRAVEEGRIRFWIGVVVCTTVAMASHILAALLIPVEVVLFLLWWSHSRKHLLAGGLALLCVTVPYVPLAIDRLKWVFEPADTGFARYTFGALLSTLGGAYTRGIFSTLDESIVLIASATAAVIALFGLLLIDTPDRPASKSDRIVARLSLIAWAFIPAIIIALISINRPLFTDRYLIWIQPAFYLAVALGVYALWRWWKPLAVVALSALLIVNAFGIVTQATTPSKSDFRSAAQAIGRAIKPGEAIVFQIPYVQYDFDFYFRRPYAALGGPYTNYRNKTGGYLNSEVAELRQIAALLSGHPSFWVVWSEADWADARQLFPRWLTANARETFHAEYPQVNVSRYELKQ
jgi:mannosyltransferase